MRRLRYLFLILSVISIQGYTCDAPSPGGGAPSAGAGGGSGYGSGSGSNYVALPPISSSPAIPLIISSTNSLNQAANQMAKNPLDASVRANYQVQIQNSAAAQSQFKADIGSGKYDVANLPQVMNQLGQQVQAPPTTTASTPGATNDDRLVTTEGAKISNPQAKDGQGQPTDPANSANSETNPNLAHGSVNNFLMEGSSADILKALAIAQRDGVTVVIGRNESSGNPFEMGSFVERASSEGTSPSREEIRAEMDNRIQKVLSAPQPTDPNGRQVRGFLENLKSDPEAYHRFLDHAADALFLQVNQARTNVPEMHLLSGHIPQRRLASTNASTVSSLVNVAKVVGLMGVGGLAGMGLLFLLLYRRSVKNRNQAAVVQAQYVRPIPLASARSLRSTSRS